MLERSVDRRRGAAGHRSRPNVVRAHLEAIATAARRLLEPPMTLPYPDYMEARPPGYRGVILFHYEKCIGCSLCAQICPARAIKMYRVPGDKRLRPGYNVGRCIFCGLCVDICPVDALSESLVHDRVYEDVPSMDMDPVDWALWSRRVAEEERSPERPLLRARLDPERGIVYEEVQPGETRGEG